MVLAISWTAFTIWLLYSTTAFIEYLSIVPFLSRYTRLDLIGYHEFKAKDPELRYSDYMLAQNQNFLVRLFSCPVCFGVWIALTYSYIFDSVWSMPLIYAGGLLAYFSFKLIIRCLKNVTPDI